MVDPSDLGDDDEGGLPAWSADACVASHDYITHDQFTEEEVRTYGDRLGWGEEEIDLVLNGPDPETCGAWWHPDMPPWVAESELDEAVQNQESHYRDLVLQLAEYRERLKREEERKKVRRGWLADDLLRLIEPDHAAYGRDTRVVLAAPREARASRRVRVGSRGSPAGRSTDDPHEHDVALGTEAALVTACDRQEPPRPPLTPEQRAVFWEVRSRVCAALAELEAGDPDAAAEILLESALEAIRAAR